MRHNQTFQHQTFVKVQFLIVEKLDYFLDVFFNVCPFFLHRREHKVAGIKFRSTGIYADEDVENSLIWKCIRNSV